MMAQAIELIWYTAQNG